MKILELYSEQTGYSLVYSFSRPVDLGHSKGSALGHCEGFSRVISQGVAQPRAREHASPGRARTCAASSAHPRARRRLRGARLRALDGGNPPNVGLNYFAPRGTRLRPLSAVDPGGKGPTTSWGAGGSRGGGASDEGAAACLKYTSKAAAAGAAVAGGNFLRCCWGRVGGQHPESGALQDAFQDAPRPAATESRRRLQKTRDAGPGARTRAPRRPRGPPGHFGPTRLGGNV